MGFETIAMERRILKLERRVDELEAALGRLVTHNQFGEMKPSFPEYAAKELEDSVNKKAEPIPEPGQHPRGCECYVCFPSF